MPKTTKLDTGKADKRKASRQALKDRGSASKENSIKALRERVALLEEIIGV